jgi:hypothetical protein
MKIRASAAFLLLFTSISYAQGNIATPAASPAATVQQTVGITKITINYARPGVKGRTVWGDLVPWGEVWRAGANAATTIEFADEVTVGGTKVPKGKYAFFAIPGKDKWTLIINKKAQQWGAYDYSAADDVVRIDAKPETIPHVERLRFSIESDSDDLATVALEWEKVRVSMKVQIATREMMIKRIADATEKADEKMWGIFFGAAKYYLENDLDVNKALQWVDISMKTDKSFWSMELKGRILIKMKKSEDGIALLQKAADESKKDKSVPGEYWKNLEKEIEALKKSKH